MTTLELSRTRCLLIEIDKAVNKISPPYMKDLFTPRHIPYNLRNVNKLYVPHSRTQRFGLNCFAVGRAALWNTESDYVKSVNLQDFKNFLSTWT